MDYPPITAITDSFSEWLQIVTKIQCVALAIGRIEIFNEIAC